MIKLTDFDKSQLTWCIRMIFLHPFGLKGRCIPFMIRYALLVWKKRGMFDKRRNYKCDPCGLHNQERVDRYGDLRKK